MTAPAQIHLMLVSEQAAPNLLPALDPAMKPRQAVLLVSQKMVQRAQALQNVLKEVGIQTHTVPLPDEHNMAALESTLMDVAAQRDGQSIALNVTGGNKLMALAAQAVAQAAGWPAFYVDVDTDQIIWLDKTRPAQALTQQLRLRHYLLGYGHTLAEGIDRPQPNAAWQTLLQDLIVNVGSLEEAIGQLNHLSQEAFKNLRVTLSPRQRDHHGLDALLRKFETAHILKRQGDQLVFATEAARTFANGGWIEHHVYQTVCQVTGDLAIRDKAANLQVRDSSGQPNEIDIAFMARNRLFMVECKTARMNHPDDLKANDTLYKLAENCRRIGGLGTRGMLATYRPLRPAEQRLAQALNIEVVANRDLARLGERLKQWVKPKL
ncbi:MAG: DUF1887 family CARF protein [Hydrogenophaga sp.]|nr:DUF1887 family CARF protein [Hydrogenophaga sp.]